MIYLFSDGANSKARHLESTKYAPAICLFKYYSTMIMSKHSLQRNLGNSSPSDPMSRRHSTGVSDASSAALKPGLDLPLKFSPRRFSPSLEELGRNLNDLKSQKLSSTVDNGP
jgi:hypothetical protein